MKLLKKGCNFMPTYNQKHGLFNFNFPFFIPKLPLNENKWQPVDQTHARYAKTEIKILTTLFYWILFSLVTPWDLHR